MENFYQEEDLLLLSGIQHFAFCPRQWALIHIEQVWSENARTVEGKNIHENADDTFFNETRKDTRIVRAMPLISKRLGLRGIADVVEFKKENGNSLGVTCRINGFDGLWQPIPVEYKRGQPKKDNCDSVQLCAQAFALEEMMNVGIEYGYIFYNKIRHREKIIFDDKLRDNTVELAKEMHILIQKGITPKAEKGKNCCLCSLIEKCHPKISLKNTSVKNYLEKILDIEEVTE